MTDPARHRLVALFPDFDAARPAIADLELAGLDASGLHFDEASRQRAEHAPESGGRDERFLRRAMSSWLRGLALGIVLGTVAGLLGGLVAFGFRGQFATVGIMAFALGGGAVGAGLGVVAGGVWRHEQTPAWEETFEAPHEGEARLVVEVTSAEELQLARRVLGAHSARVLDGD